MTFRVATYTTTNNIFNQSQRLQVSYAQASQQSASGLKSENFEGIAGDAQRLLGFQTEYNSLATQSLVIKSAQNRINAMRNLTDTINSTLSKASSLFTSIQSGLDLYGSAASNVEHATVLRNELASLLNSKVGGDYLFSGSNYDIAPVDLTNIAYNPMAAPGTPDTNYYAGNGVIDSVRATPSLHIEYGITAADPAFEKAFRALTLFIANPTDINTITDSFALIKGAIDGVAGLNGTLIAKSNIIDSQLALNTASAEYFSAVVSDLRDADVAAAAVQATQIEAQLQASFSSLAKLLQLRLTDFLR